MHKCEYTDRIEIKNHKLTRIVRAEYENARKTVCFADDVLKQNENDVTTCRHIYYSRMTGYGVSFQGERNPFGDKETDNHYSQTYNNGKSHINLGIKNEPSEKDYQTVVSVHPDFKNILDNNKFYTNADLIETIYFWNRNREETTKLLLNNKNTVVRTERFYKLTDKKRNEIISFCTEHKCDDYRLSTILELIKLNKLYPNYTIDNLYRLEEALETKESVLEFLHQTVEFQTLTEEKKEEYNDYYNNSYSCNYKTFKRLINLSRKYPKTTFNDLDKIFLNYYTPCDTIIKFYITYNDEFKYTTQKHKFYSAESVKTAFEYWSKYKNETEMLYAYDLEYLATCDAYYEQSKETKKQVIKFILKYKNIIRNFLNIRYSDLKIITKYADSDLNDEEMKLIFNDLHRFENVKVDSKIVEYLKSHRRIQIDEYAKYLDHCVELKHDLKDSYWKTPKCFTKRQKKIQVELKNLEILKEKNKAKDFMNINNNYLLLNKDRNINGYHIYLPTDLDTVQTQATVLHQCLMTNNYPQKVIDKKCILIFVEKDKNPVATCEISLDKKILQYRGMKNCNADDEQQKAMNKYLEKFKVA